MAGDGLVTLHCAGEKSGRLAGFFAEGAIGRPHVTPTTTSSSMRPSLVVIAPVREILQDLAQLRIEGRDGCLAHMRARESALRVATLQILVDRRPPGFRANSPFTRYRKQTPLTEL